MHSNIEPASGRSESRVSRNRTATECEAETRTKISPGEAAIGKIAASETASLHAGCRKCRGYFWKPHVALRDQTSQSVSNAY